METEKPVRRRKVMYRQFPLEFVELFAFDSRFHGDGFEIFFFLGSILLTIHSCDPNEIDELIDWWHT